MRLQMKNILATCGLLLGYSGCAVAPSADDTATGTTSADTTTGDATTEDATPEDATTEDDSDTTGGEACTPQSAVEIELTSGGLTRSGVLVQPCTVTAVEQDQQDPRKWTFGFECDHPAELVLTLDPPLDVPPPLQVGAELTGIVGNIVEAGEVFRIFELEDMSGHELLAVLEYVGPANGMIDHPTAPENPFVFEWSTEPDCTTVDETCGVVDQLRLEAIAGADPLVLDPSERYGNVFEPPNRTYGLWVGDSWTSDCDGQPTRSLSYALMLLVPI